MEDISNHLVADSLKFFIRLDGVEWFLSSKANDSRNRGVLFPIYSQTLDGNIHSGCLTEPLDHRGCCEIQALIREAIDRQNSHHLSAHSFAMSVLPRPCAAAKPKRYPNMDDWEHLDYINVHKTTIIFTSLPAKKVYHLHPTSTRLRSDDMTVDDGEPLVQETHANTAA